MSNFFLLIEIFSIFAENIVMVKIDKLPSNVNHLYLDVIGDEKVNVYESRNHVYIYYVIDAGIFRINKRELRDLSVKLNVQYEKLCSSSQPEY